MKKLQHILLYELTTADYNKLMITPFGFAILILSQIFYPISDNLEEKVLFVAIGSTILITIMIWAVSLIEFFLFPRSNYPLPDYPYDLFYHYKNKGVGKEGYIYLVKRLEDGVYKIGRASNLDKRIGDLRKEYGPLSIIAVWEVTGLTRYEQVALQRTKQFAYDEIGRNELRLMDSSQCYQFIIDFTQYVVETGAHLVKETDFLEHQIPLLSLKEKADG